MNVPNKQGDINDQIDYRKTVGFAATRLIKDYGRALAPEKARGRIDAARERGSAATADYWSDVLAELEERLK